MFAKSVVETDLFIDMPMSTQALYFHMGMNADDDGFVSSPMKIQRMLGASIDDYRLLIAKGFLHPFDTGVVVITHWKISNYIQKDRYVPTIYMNEKSQIALGENNMYTPCIHDVYEQYPKCTLSIGKERKVKEREVKERLETRGTGEETNTRTSSIPSDIETECCYGKYNNVMLTDSEYQEVQTMPNFEYLIDSVSEFIEKSKFVKGRHIGYIRVKNRNQTQEVEAV